MALPAQEQVKLLRLPLIISGVIVVALLISAGVLHWLKPSKEPQIVESPAPASSIRNLVFSKEDNEYVLYFSLCDEAGKEVARTGDVNLKISQLGTIGMEGGPEFVNETVLLDAKYDVGLASYRWVEIGGGFFFSQHQLIIPKRIPPNLFKLPPRAGMLGKISIRFRDQKVAGSQLYQEKRLLFP